METAIAPMESFDAAPHYLDRAMATAAEQVHYEFLRNTLYFGLNMTFSARVTQFAERAERSVLAAIDALFLYSSFRSGVALPQAEHDELSAMAIQLSEEIIDLRSIWESQTLSTR